jgi:hypothetical protein
MNQTVHELVNALSHLLWAVRSRGVRNDRRSAYRLFGAPSLRLARVRLRMRDVLPPHTRFWRQ